MRKPLAVSAGGVLLCAGLFTTLLAWDDKKPGNPSNRDRVERGFAIAPVTLNLKDKNRELVGLGSYMVNAVAGCNDCHTCPSYDPKNNPYQGKPGAVNAENYLAGGVPFGPFTSRNLTPQADEGNLPAGLTFDQFEHVLLTGIDPDKKHLQISPLLQVMPWPVYRHMTGLEMRAVYEYLSAIPPATPGSCTGAGQ